MDETMTSVTCPPRFQWNAAEGSCVEIEAIPEPYKAEVINDCEPGYAWNDAMRMCSQSVTRHERDADAQPPIIDRGGLTPYGYLDDYYDIDVDSDVIGDDEPPAPPTHNGPNPCLTGYEFFYEFPGDAKYYIQCDEWRNMYVQACPDGLHWDTAVATCLDHSVNVMQTKKAATTSPKKSYSHQQQPRQQPSAPVKPSPNHQQQPPPPAPPSALNLDEALNPCKLAGQQGNYHQHPFDERRFIVCSNGRPYIMICLLGAYWDAGVKNCVSSPATDGSSKKRGYNGRGQY